MIAKVVQLNPLLIALIFDSNNCLHKKFQKNILKIVTLTFNNSVDILTDFR